MEISRYFSLSGMDLTTDQGIECNPRTFAVYPSRASGLIGAEAHSIMAPKLERSIEPTTSWAKAPARLADSLVASMEALHCLSRICATDFY